MKYEIEIYVLQDKITNKFASSSGGGLTTDEIRFAYYWLSEEQMVEYELDELKEFLDDYEGYEIKKVKVIYEVMD